MTIHGAFNDIAEDLGGIADTSGTIVGAIDALNDVLAGSDQQRAGNIEEAVRLLGLHIGGGGGIQFGNGIRVDVRLDDDSDSKGYVVYCYNSEQDYIEDVLDEGKYSMRIAPFYGSAVLPANMTVYLKLYQPEDVTFGDGRGAWITGTRDGEPIEFTDYTTWVVGEPGGETTYMIIKFVVPDVEWRDEPPGTDAYTFLSFNVLPPE